MLGKVCMIYDNKICDECRDCDYCDINPDKICDDCGMCIDVYDYSAVQIDDLLIDHYKDVESIDEESKNHKDCNCGCKHD